VSAPSALIDAYLDRLLLALTGRPADMRRVLSEVESHLYDAVDEGIDRGLDAEAAVAEALERFGTPGQVARRYRRIDLSRPLVREITSALAVLAAVGLLAVGASGLLSMGFRATWGSSFVAGDLPGVTYTAERCAEYEALHPEAPSCALAAAAHHADEVELYRIAVGVLGAVLLAGWWFASRRRPPAVGALPGAVVPTAGAATFGLAGAALAVQAVGAGANGAGQWLTAAIVALVVAAVYARQLAQVLTVA
jgi:hypothetical protein